MSSPRIQFVVFFLVATAIYGSLHGYLWWKITRQLRLRGPAAVWLALFFLLMVVAPFLGRLLRDGSVVLFAGTSVLFVWMGFAFYLFLLNLGVDLWNLGAAFGRRRFAIPVPSASGGPRLFWGILAAVCLIVLAAAAEAAWIRVRRVTLPTAKLPPGAAAVRVVQVSDVHLGLLVGERRLAAILRRVREARPDLLVATGDLLDAVGDHLDPLAAAWRAITPRLGKFAVTGNHEYYAGLAGSLRFFEEAGFRVLREETVTIPGVLNLIGKDYPGRRALGGAPPPPRPLAELVDAGDPRLFNLFLFHTPTRFVEEAAPLGVDLQLSGHTHDGQLFPFRLLVRLFFRFTAGLHREGSSLLYVSRGTGTWGPPLRFLAPPEVTVFTLVPAAP